MKILVTDPVIPFVTLAPPNLNRYTVKGISSGSDRFNLNFMCGDSWDKSDIAFHFDVRFSYGVSRDVVITNYRKKYWAHEDNNGTGRFPFTPGREFVIEICVNDKEFEVAVDGKHFLKYAHRIKKEAVKYFGIGDDIVVKEILIHSNMATLSKISIIREESVTQKEDPSYCYSDDGGSGTA